MTARDVKKERRENARKKRDLTSGCVKRFLIKYSPTRGHGVGKLVLARSRCKTIFHRIKYALIMLVEVDLASSAKWIK